MEISVALTVDRPYVARVVKATLGWRYWLFRLGGPFIVLMAVLPGRGAGDVVAGFFGVLAFLVPEIYQWAALRQAKGRAQARFTVTKAALLAEAEGETETHEWASFHHARETRGFWLLRIRGGTSIPLPKGKLSPQEAEQVRAVLRENGLLR